MEFVILGISIIVLLVNIGCWIFIVVKQFQTQGALHGILGIICSLYAFIWGWMNVKKLNAMPIMMTWSACIVLGIILNLIAQGMMQ